MQLLKRNCLSRELKARIAANRAQALRRSKGRAAARLSGTRSPKRQPKCNAPDSGSATENDEPRGVTGVETAAATEDDSWLEALEEALQDCGS